MTSKLKTDVLETVSGSGTIALTNQLSGMTSASVPVLTTSHIPTLTAAQMPSGSLLKTSTRNYPASASTSSSGFVSVGGSVNYTVVNAGCALRVTQNVNLGAGSDTNYWRRCRLLIDGQSYGALTVAHHDYDNLYVPVTMDEYFPSLSLTAGQVVVFQIQIATDNSSYTTAVDDAYGDPTLIIQEIKG